jgi:hypothetical protein
MVSRGTGLSDFTRFLQLQAVQFDKMFTQMASLVQAVVNRGSIPRSIDATPLGRDTSHVGISLPLC